MKIITLIPLLFCWTLSFSQIKVSKPAKPTLIGQVAPMGVLSIKCEKQGDLVIFTYRDAQYSQIIEFKNFSFLDVDGALDNFYEAVISVIESKEELEIELPNSTIYIKPGNILGIPSVSFSHFEDGVSGFSHDIARKHVDKLFNKK